MCDLGHSIQQWKTPTAPYFFRAEVKLVMR